MSSEDEKSRQSESARHRLSLARLVYKAQYVSDSMRHGDIEAVQSSGCHTPV
jgi:hypothetical protein